MVRIDEITLMVEKDLDDFYRDRDRFKGLKLLIDFDSEEYQPNTPGLQFTEPKFKKRLKTSHFIKNKGEKGLF